MLLATGTVVEVPSTKREVKLSTIFGPLYLEVPLYKIGECLRLRIYRNISCKI